MADPNTSKPEVPNGIILVSGPSRGGKSRWAEHLLSAQETVTYVATSAPRSNDPSWDKRIHLHRERRPLHWQLREPGSKLAECIRREEANQPLLIDALGGFVAHHLELDASAWNMLCQRLIDAVTSSRCTVVLVIEETGWGVVPPTRIGGLFRDRLGALAQQLDRVADAAWLVLQGRALDLHALGRVVP